MVLRLLLAHADTAEPVLPDGVPLEAAADAPAAASEESEEDPLLGFRVDDQDPNAIDVQRWGIVAPEGEQGDRLLELIAPLRRERERLQNDEKAVIYRVRPGLSPEDSARWWKDVYLAESLRERERPRYLLLLGGAEQVSWDLQIRLASDAYVGRLAFPTDQGYEAYVAKLLAHERKAATAGARAVFYATQDGTSETADGYRDLVQPLITLARQDGWSTGEIVHPGEGRGLSRRELLAVAADRAPTMLFTLSHGLGAPRGGWRSHEEQRRMQGAMKLTAGETGERLMPEDLATGAFLPGGAWFYFACLGAGTPSTSAYRHWLAQLQAEGRFGGGIDDVLASLPQGAPPFVGALPQAALQNPDGPLAVIGHVDLAWTYGYQDYKEGPVRNLRERAEQVKARPSRFGSVLRSLVDGRRVGVALSLLHRMANAASVDLATMTDMDARLTGAAVPAPQDRSRRIHRAQLFMMRQDLAAYVLLGDPAARLQVTQSDLSAGRRPPNSAIAPERIEEAVIAAIVGAEPLDTIAQRFGVSRDTLDRWVGTYKRAGRDAVSRPG